MEDNDKRPEFVWEVPAELEIPPDPLRCRLDFHHQVVVMTIFDEETITTRPVSALDVAHSLASDLSYGTGLLPPGTLWFQNTRDGPTYALYVEPQIWKVALQLEVDKPPNRYTIPMPGLVFLCSPGQPPWVYAVKKKPTKETDAVFAAPLCNVFESGHTCPGTHKYPTRVADMVKSFFMSFFSSAGDLKKRSKMFPNNVVLLWEHLDNKKKFPMSDLVEHGTIKDIMYMEKR